MTATAQSAPPGQGSKATQPFRKNTRQRCQKVGPVAVSAGQTVPTTFPQVGFLSRIYLAVAALATDTAATPNVAAGAFGAGPYNLLKRITGLTNLGTANVFDLSGWGAHLATRLIDRDVVLEQALTGVTAPDPMYTYPTTGFVQNTAKAVNFVIVLPVSVNDGDQFQIGMINLSAPEIRFTLNLTFGSQADVYASADTINFGGNVNVYYQYYEAPPASKIDSVVLPPRVMHRLIEDRTAILNTGDTTYLVPRQGILLQMLHSVSLNGALDVAATNVLGRKLVFNKTDTPYNFDYIVDRINNRLRYGPSELNPSTYVWDFFNAQQMVSRGDLRDAIDTERLNSLESIVTIASGATLGSGNNFVDTVRRILQRY